MSDAVGLWHLCGIFTGGVLGTFLTGVVGVDPLPWLLSVFVALSLGTWALAMKRNGDTEEADA